MPALVFRYVCMFVCLCMILCACVICVFVFACTYVFIVSPGMVLMLDSPGLSCKDMIMMMIKPRGFWGWGGRRERKVLCRPPQKVTDVGRDIRQKGRVRCVWLTMDKGLERREVGGREEGD